MTAKSSCVSVLGAKRGVCSDEQVGGTDNNQFFLASKRDGLTIITYRRSITPLSASTYLVSCLSDTFKKSRLERDSTLLCCYRVLPSLVSVSQPLTETGRTRWRACRVSSGPWESWTNRSGPPSTGCGRATRSSWNWAGLRAKSTATTSSTSKTKRRKSSAEGFRRPPRSTLCSWNGRF